MDIQKRTNSKIVQNQKIEIHEWTYESQESKRSYAVYPRVFSPAIFLGTAFLTSEILKNVHSGQNFLEIGCGCGVTSIEVALQIKNCDIFASDVSEEAMKNTEFNMNRYKIKFETKVSDIFGSWLKQDFNVIYWNFPFHPTNFQHHTMLERAIRDPGYHMLETFLSQAGEWLKKDGYLLLGFSEKMGDPAKLNSLAVKYQWKCSKIAQMEPTNGMICLFKLQK